MFVAGMAKQYPFSDASNIEGRRGNIETQAILATNYHFLLKIITSC